MTTPTAHAIKVPGATLYYEKRGRGPLLILIPGGPMDAGGFDGLAARLADRFTVVAYDPRGNSRSVLDGKPADQDMDVHGDDAAALIWEVGGGPACVFGGSGGAQIGLNLAARYPTLVRTLVAHEPPCTLMLPEPAKSKALADGEAMLTAYRKGGLGAAMAESARTSGLGPDDGPPPPKTPEEGATLGRMMGNMEYFIAHGVMPISTYLPDVDRLRSGEARIVIGVGRDSPKGQLAADAAKGLAKALGTPPVLFPGGHGPSDDQLDEFAEVLMGALV